MVRLATVQFLFSCATVLHLQCVCISVSGTDASTFESCIRVRYLSAFTNGIQPSSFSEKPRRLKAFLISLSQRVAYQGACFIFFLFLFLFRVIWHRDGNGLVVCCFFFIFAWLFHLFPFLLCKGCQTGLGGMDWEGKGWAGRLLKYRVIGIAVCN